MSRGHIKGRLRQPEKWLSGTLVEFGTDKAAIRLLKLASQHREANDIVDFGPNLENHDNNRLGTFFQKNSFRILYVHI